MTRARRAASGRAGAPTRVSVSRRQGEKIGRDLTEDDVEPATWFMASLAASFSALDLAQAIAASGGTHVSWRRGGPTAGTCSSRPRSVDRHRSSARSNFDPADPIGSQQPVAALVPFTTHFNVSGQPAISLPMHENADGLPIGVQLVAAYGREDVLLRVASQLEAAHPWADRVPALSRANGRRHATTSDRRWRRRLRRPEASAIDRRAR